MNNIIVCKICGYTGKNITKHIQSKHHMTVKTYKQQYNAEIECEASKQLRVTNRRNTIRTKYGVDNISQLPDIKQKIHTSFIQTLLNKYNTTNINDIPDIKNKIIQNRHKALIAKYGTTNIMQIPEYKEKMRNKIQALWDDLNSTYNSINYGQFSNLMPNNTEQKIIDLQIPNLYYTGNFKFWITFKNNRRKNPDFIIKPFSKAKKVIELFGGLNFFHTKDEEVLITQLYNEIGIQCLIIWDYDINTKNKLDIIHKKILAFINE